MKQLYLQAQPAALVDEVVGVGEQFMQNLEGLLQKLMRNRGNILWGLCLILLTVLLAKVALRVISAVTGHVLKNKRYQNDAPASKRMRTLMTLLRSVTRYLIYFVAFLVVLSILGMGKPLSNLLLTAGIGSLAIGFGAQNLVRDVVSGMFMIFENQFSVGDYIKIDDVEGTVEATAMRVTYLRSMKGDQIIIPNGTIERVINYNKGNAVAAVTISTAYESDTRKVMELIGLAVGQYAKPMKQWEVERGIRLAVKEMFDKSGVEFPYPHMVTVPYQKPQEVVGREDIFVQKQQPEQECASWQSIDADDLEL